jgi:hypothetical protein
MRFIPIAEYGLAVTRIVGHGLSSINNIGAICCGNYSLVYFFRFYMWDISSFSFTLGWIFVIVYSFSLIWNRHEKKFHLFPNVVGYILGILLYSLIGRTWIFASFQLF